MEKSLIILRGLPSSGKSSFAKLLETDAICCADDFHYVNGEYKWNPNNIGIAHMWCQTKCVEFMEENHPKIVIANTNTTEKEMQPYIDMANEYGYLVYYVIIEKRHSNINDHNVPNDAIEKMRERFEIKL